MRHVHPAQRKLAYAGKLTQVSLSLSSYTRAVYAAAGMMLHYDAPAAARMYAA